MKSIETSSFNYGFFFFLVVLVCSVFFFPQHFHLVQIHLRLLHAAEEFTLPHYDIHVSSSLMCLDFYLLGVYLFSSNMATTD